MVVCLLTCQAQAATRLDSATNDTNIAPFASEASEFNIGNSTYIGQTVTTFMDSITIWSAYK